MCENRIFFFSCDCFSKRKPPASTSYIHACSTAYTISLIISVTIIINLMSAAELT